jgi:formylglycine-generating enzyme required for sulfatase activity
MRAKGLRNNEFSEAPGGRRGIVLLLLSLTASLSFQSIRAKHGTIVASIVLVAALCAGVSSLVGIYQQWFQPIRDYFFPTIVAPITPAPSPQALPQGQAPQIGEGFRDCADCPEVVMLPAGDFEMGDTTSLYSQPVHHVRVGQPFALAKYPVTRGEYARFVQATGRTAPPSLGFPQSDRDPVVNVSWYDAKAYVAWLSRTTGKGYRLPTEAEWEYAARARTTTAYYWGDQVRSGQANCNGCGSLWDDTSTSPVGSFVPNGFGLYDMAGNVWQWVEDCPTRNYDNAPSDSSTLASSGNCDRRVVRGGSWDYVAKYARAGYRYGDGGGPDRHYDNTGFRVARTQ